MFNEKLIGADIRFTVSEPEEFFFKNGGGPFAATICSILESMLVLKLNSPVVFKDKPCNLLVASLRHEGSSWNDLLQSKKIFVNFVPVLLAPGNSTISESEIVESVTKWRGSHLIGDVFR